MADELVGVPCWRKLVCEGRGRRRRFRVGSFEAVEWKDLDDELGVRV